MHRPWRVFALSLVGLLVVLAAGCAGLYPAPRPGPASRVEELPQDPEARSLLNGERIYFTGVNIDGERIRYTGGPDFGGMMMGTWLTCASCHGVDARGGEHIMHMQIMEAPDIRIAALSAEAHHEEGSAEPGEDHQEEGASPHDEDASQEGFAYTLEDFRRAVVEGRHPNGEPLDPNMPRWQLSDRDLRDLYNFLASFPP